jgi:hypothetical protein
VWPGLRVHKVGGHTAGLADRQRRDAARHRGAHVRRLALLSQRRDAPAVQIITSLPEMLTAFDTIDRLAGSTKLVVAGHDPQVAERFKPVEPGIIKIA